MSTCSQCGTALAEGAAFCPNCGAAVVAPAAATDPGLPYEHAGQATAGAAPAGAAFGGMLSDWQSSASRPSVAGATSVVNELKSSVGGRGAVPQLALAAAAIGAVIGALYVISGIDTLINTFDAFKNSASLGLWGLLEAVGALLIAALWLGIAWLTYGGSRFARPMTIVAGAATALAGLNGGLIYVGLRWASGLAAVLALAAIALMFVAEVTTYLSSGPRGQRSATLVAAEALLIWFGVTGIVIGIGRIFFTVGINNLLGGLGSYIYGGGGRGYVGAVALIAAAVAALVFAGAVGRAAAQGRLILSIVAAALFILVGVASMIGTSWFPLVMLVAIAASLWLAADARLAFGDTPLNLGTGMARPAGPAMQPMPPAQPVPPMPPSPTPNPTPYDQPTGGEPPLA